MTERILVRTRAAGCMAALLLAGCGSIIGLPVAVWQNKFIGLRGQIVDERGMPVDGVEVRATRRHILWDPAGGGTRDVPDTTTFQANHTLDIWPRRAFQISYTFNKAGHREARLEAYHSGYELEMDERVVGSTWPLDSRVTIVLENQSRPRPPQLMRGGYLSLDPGSESAVQLAPGIVLHAEIHAQKALALWFTDHKPGFVTVHPDLAVHPLAHLTQAPAGGYSPELVLSGAKLQKFSDSGSVMVPDRNLFFYFHTDGKYGKAMLSMPVGFGASETGLRLTYLVQPDGTRDVSGW